MSLLQKIAEASKKGGGRVFLGVSGLLSLAGCASPFDSAEFLRNYKEPGVTDLDFNRRNLEKDKEDLEDNPAGPQQSSKEEKEETKSADTCVFTSAGNNMYLDLSFPRPDPSMQVPEKYVMVTNNINNIFRTRQKRGYRVELYNFAFEFIEENVPILSPIARGVHYSGQALQTALNETLNFNDDENSVAKVKTDNIWTMNVEGKLGFKGVFTKHDFLGVTGKFGGISLTNSDIKRDGLGYSIMLAWEVRF